MINQEKALRARKTIEEAYKLYFMVFLSFLGLGGFFMGLVGLTMWFAMLTGEIPGFFYVLWNIFDALCYIGLVLFGLWLISLILEKQVIPRKEKQLNEFVDLVAERINKKHGRKK